MYSLLINPVKEFISDTVCTFGSSIFSFGLKFLFSISAEIPHPHMLFTFSIKHFNIFVSAFKICCLIIPTSGSSLGLVLLTESSLNNA